MSTKALIQKVRAEIEAHEGRGWLKGYEEGLATREREVQVLQEALTARNALIRELKRRRKDETDSIYEALENALVHTPDPEPDWLDAPAVLARHVKHALDSQPSLWVNLGDGLWGHGETTKRVTAHNLRDVTPLYPKGQDA